MARSRLIRVVQSSHSKSITGVLLHSLEVFKSWRDHSLDLEFYSGKIQEKAMFQPGRTQLRANDGKMHVLKGFDRFQIDDHLALHHNIEPVCANFDAVVGDCDYLLLLDVKRSLAEFQNESVLVNRFQEARAELPMNFNGSTDDGFG